VSLNPYPYAATLTVEKVRSSVAAIAAMADDNEAAHSAEDDLRKEVLTAIAISQLKGTDVLLAALFCLDHVGYTPSDLPSTHAHDLKTWRAA
jgi:hypothetical protein